MHITAKDLSFVYSPKTPFAAHALNGVTLDIKEGEFFGIIGHTGSGKSTFLQHLNALIPVTSGSLKVGEFDLADKKCNFKKLRSKVGMLFQYPEYQLFADTVFADVAFGYGNFFPEVKGEELARRVREAMETVGLDYFSVKDKSPFDLSGGQKRRAAIAGVIITKPEVLVLDEPAAGLDPQGKQDIMNLMHELHKTTCKTVIMVSHDMDEIAENCQRVAVFNKGSVEVVLPPAELFKDARRLKELGLDIPVTAEVALGLKQCNIDIDTDFTKTDFIAKITELYKSRSRNG